MRPQETAELNLDASYDESFKGDPKTTSTRPTETAEPILVGNKYPSLTFTGNVKGNSGIYFGESKYDKNINFSELSNLDQARARQQSLGASFINGLVSRTAAVLPKVGAGFAYVGSAPLAVAKGDIDTMINNDMANKMEEADESLRHLLPVYGSVDYDGDSIWDMLWTQKFWFDDAFDGLSFAASAFVPAAGVGALGKGLNLAGKAAKAYQTASPFVVTAYNTISEAGFEADDTKKSVYQHLINDGVDPETANEKASNAAVNTWAANAAILLGPNFIMSKFMLGGFKQSTAGIRKTITHGLKEGGTGASNVGLEALKMGGLGVISEGLWEEGMQTAVQKYEERSARGDKDDTRVQGYANEWVNGFQTKDGVKSMILGALIGGGMGAVSGFSNAKSNNKYVKEFGEEWKQYKMDYLDNHANQFQERVGNINKANGDIDVEKAVKSFYQTINQKGLFTEGLAATVNNDKFHDKFNKDIGVARFLYPYLSDNTHFETTDDALEYAISKIDEMEGKDGVDTESLDYLKETAVRVKDSYDKVKDQSIRFENNAKDDGDIMFSNEIAKALFYEDVKRSSLTNFKNDLDDNQSQEIDNVINDSNKKSAFLLNKKEREDIKKRYKKNIDANMQRNINITKRLELEKEIEDGKLTSEEVTAKKEEIRNLQYDNLESEIIDGSRIPGEFEINKPEAVREETELGLRGASNYQIGMSYKKKEAREKALKDYNEGNATVNDVYNSIMNNVTDASPLNSEDKRVLIKLSSDLRDIENDQNIDKSKMQHVAQTVEFINNKLINSPTEDSYWESEEDFNDALKDYNKLKEAANTAPKIDNTLSNSKFESLGDNLKRTQSDLEEVAARQLVDEGTLPVLNSYKSNPDGFADIHSVERALNRLGVVEAGINNPLRTNLKNSKKGRELIADIKSLRSELKGLLKIATENDNNKKVADINSKVNYGETRSKLLFHQNTLEILEKYLGQDYVNNIINNMNDDNKNFMHVEKLVNDIKALPEDEFDLIKKALAVEKENLLDKIEKSIEDSLEPYATKVLAKVDSEERRRRAKEDYDIKIGNDIFAYRENPSSIFGIMISSLFRAKDFNDGVSRPINRFELNNNSSEFLNDLISKGKEIGSGSERVSYEDLLDIVSQHVLIESIDSLESSLNSDLNTLQYLEDEKKAAIAAKKADEKLAPSRQQRISLFELMRWFNTATRNSGFGSFAYLKGLAGTGKTTVVSRLFLKLSGVKSENVLAIANNDSSTKTINDSLGLNGNKTVDTIEEADINDATEIMFIDEVGALSEESLDRVVGIVESVNDKRKSNDLKPLRVIAIGDPSQISKKGSFYSPIQDITKEELEDMTIITPLTIPFRSDISSVLAVQDAYHLNSNKVEGLTVSATDIPGKVSKGVHVGTTKDMLIKQMETHNENGRTKALIVGTFEDVEKWTKELGGRIKDLRILTYIDAQGITSEDVFIDIDPSIEGVEKGDQESVIRKKTKARNTIMYTATSRAQDYIYINDHTGTFKNKVSDAVLESEKVNVENKEEYQEQYVKDVKNDISVIKTGTMVKPTKKTEKPEDDVVEDDTVEDEEIVRPAIEDDDIVETDDVDLDEEDSTTNEVDENENTDLYDGYEEEGEGIHNVMHTRNDVEKIDGKYEVPYKKGAPVYYVKLNRGSKTYVEIFTHNEQNGKVRQIGVLSEEESLKVLKRPLKDIINDSSIVANAFEEAGKLIDDITVENASSVVATGRINAKPIPLTYMFKEAAKTGEIIFDDILDAFKNVFGRRGFSIGKAKVEIFKPNKIKKEKIGGIKAGIPYMLVEVTREAKDEEGSIKTQYVKLSPRKIDRDKDNHLVQPIVDFIESSKVIEDILKDIDNGQHVLGTESFNELVKKFKLNYKVKADGSTIVKSTKGNVTLSDARKLIPGITNEQFIKVQNNIKPLIDGFYGIGEKVMNVSPSEYEEIVLNEKDTVKKEFNGVEYDFEEATNTYYRLEDQGNNAGKIQTLTEYVKSNKEVTLIPKINDEGYNQGFMVSNELVAGQGFAQQALDALAKNNNSPNGVNIRVKKHLKTKKKTYSFITGKSLLSHTVNNKNYIKFLRNIYSEEVGSINNVDISSEGAMSWLENDMIEKGIVTAENISFMRSLLIGNPLTSDSLTKALGFENDSDVSSSLFLPLDFKEINDLGENIEENSEELAEYVESHFSKILPTSVQIKLDKVDPKEKKPEPPKKTKKTVANKAKDAINKIRELNKKNNKEARTSLTREFESEEEKDEFLGKKISKEKVIKLIKRSLPGIQSEKEIAFVDDVAKHVLEESGIRIDKSWGAYITGLETLDGGPRGQIVLSPDSDGMFRVNVVKHEIFHKVYTERLSEKERVRLRQAFVEEDMHKNNSESSVINTYDSIEFEEFVAEQYQLWNKGQVEYRKDFITKMFRKLRDFIRYVVGNRTYIESVFRDISNGLYKPKGLNTYGTSSAELRVIFKEPGSLKFTKGTLMGFVADLNKNGRNGYPVSKSELRPFAKERFFDKMHMLNNEINNYQDIVEELDPVENAEDIEILNGEIDKLMSSASNYSLGYKYFDKVFELAYPNWDVKTMEVVDENEESEVIEDISTNSIAADVVDWDKVNIEGKISAASKQFMSDIVWDEDAEVGGYVNPRYAYLAALQILDGVQEWKDNFLEQISEVLDKSESKQYTAVGVALQRLYSDVINKRNNKIPVKTNGKFINDYTFIYSTDNTDISSYPGKDSLESAGVSYKVIEKGNEANSSIFMNKIMDNSDVYFSKEDLFNMFSHYQKADLLRTMISNFGSQRERNPKLLKIFHSNGSKSFIYAGAKGRSAVSVVKNQIREALTNLDSATDIAELKSFIEAFARVEENKTPEDKVSFIKEFIVRIGASSLLPKDRNLKPSTVSEELYENIKYNFTVSNAFDLIQEHEVENKDGENNTAKEIEAKAEATKKINDELNTLLNNAAKFIGANQVIQRATSVKSANGETKYIHTLSNQALSTLNLLANKFQTKLFSGSTQHGNRKKSLPDFLRSDFYKNNIFSKGINTIYNVEDLDGSVETIGFSGNERVIEYSDEQYNQYMERSFSAQFLREIRNSSTARVKYSQNMYTVSNKPNNSPVQIKPLDRDGLMDALTSMALQIGSNKKIKSIKNGDNSRLINANLMARAIIEIDENGATPIFEYGKFTHYKLSPKVLDSLSDTRYASKVAAKAYELLMEEGALLAERLLDNEVMFSISDLTSENVSALIDRKTFKDVDLETLKYNKIYNYKTKKIETLKSRAEKLKIKETDDDVLRRVNLWLKETSDDKSAAFQTLDAAKKSLGEEHQMFNKQVLVDPSSIKAVVASFFANDYVNSNQLAQLVSGNPMYYKSSLDMVKRLSGAFAPGMRGLVNDKIGMPRKTNVAIFQDESYSVDKDIRGLLREAFGLNEEQIEKILPLFQTKSGKVEYTDGQGFMLPERAEEIIAGFGLSYNVGNVMKPAYFHIDPSGAPRMLKYSSVVLTDDLVGQFPVLGQLREKMRNGGKNGNTIYGEVVFESGNKVGQPVNQTNVQELFKDEKNFIDESSGFEIDNTNYRLQLNPDHSVVNKTVASPLQLGYFLNTVKKNVKRADTAYKAMEMIINNGLESVKDELSTTEGMNRVILKQLRNGEINRRTHEMYSYFTKLSYRKTLSGKARSILGPWNYPSISEKITTQISSYISKSTVNVRFKGAKAVLETAFGVDELKNDEELIRKTSSLNYRLKGINENENVENADDVLYAEVYVPRGILPKDVEDLIDNAKGEIPDQFLYSDLLGFRLPSSELHSAIPLKIVGFYDARGTNVIIAPKEIVSLHGSDYDVDALYIIRREYEEGKESKPVGYKKENGKWIWDKDYVNSEEFEALDNEAQNAVLKNLIVETYLETISTKDNRERMSSPISLIKIKKDIIDILKLRPLSKRRMPDLSNINERQKTHASSFEADAGTGIFANGIKVIASIQRSGKDKSQPKIISDINSPLELKFVIDGKEITYNELDFSDNLWEDLDSFLNSAIDNVNEQDLPNLNMTKENIKGYIALRAFGVSLEAANRLFAQDFVELSNVKGFRGHKYLKGLFRTVLSEEQLKDTEAPVNYKYLEDDLKSELSLDAIYKKALKNGRESLTIEEIKYAYWQYQGFNMFNKALSLGTYLSKIAKLLNIVKSLPVTKKEIDEVISAKESIIDKQGDLNPNFKIDVSDIFKTLPHLGAAYDVLLYQREKLETDFYRYNKTFADSMKSVYNTVKVNFDINDSFNNHQRRIDEFMKFVLNSVQWDPEYSGYHSEKERISKRGNLLTGEEAFNDRVMEMVTALKKSPLSKTNLFVSGLSIGSGNNGLAQLDFAPSATLDYEDATEYEKAFEELLNFKIENGRVVLNENQKDQKETLGYSKIQKDLMRYLILKDGLIYTKNNYATIMPLRLMSIFHRRYEHLAELLKTDKDQLKAMSDLYKVQLAVNYPEALKSINTEDKIVVNEKDQFTKYVTDNDNMYSDFSVKAFIIEDGPNAGNVDVMRTNATYPEFVKGPVITPEDGGRKYRKVYKRVGYKKGDVTIHYQLVARNGISNTYSSGRVGRSVNYNIDESFRHDIRNIQVQNPSSINGLPDTFRKIRLNSTISLTSFTDVARENQVFFKVIGRKGKKVDGQIKYSYTLEFVKTPQMTEHKPELGDRRKSLDDLKRISQKDNELSEWADVILEKASSKKTSYLLTDRYKKSRISGTAMSTYRTDEKGNPYIESDIILKRGLSDELHDRAVIHEEIHRYTSVILDAYNYKKDLLLPIDQLLSESDIKFAKDMNSLYNIYKKNPIENAEIAEKIVNVNEFVAYGLTDPEFMDHLHNTIIDNKSLLSRLLELLVKYFGNEDSYSLYEALGMSFYEYMGAEQSLSNNVRQINEFSTARGIQLLDESEENISYDNMTTEIEQEEALKCGL